MQTSGPFKYEVKEQWFSKIDAKIPGAERNGIYIYATSDDKILYIGKGEFDGGGGIGYRACAHLGSVDRDSEIMFPNHQWVNETLVSQKIKDCIGRGNFYIWTLTIEPCHFVSLVEVYFQTLYREKCGKLPELNKKIG